MATTAAERKQMKRRARAVEYIALFILIAVMGAFLFHHQILKHDYYQSRAIAQQTMDRIITPARGTIYSRDMQRLAYSVNCYTVVLAPKEMENVSEEKKEQVVRLLVDVLGADEENVRTRMKKTNSYYEVIGRKVDAQLVAQLRSVIDEKKLKGVELLEDSERYYPFNSLAANVIGFTTSDNVGAYGLEASYENTLSGTPGRITTARNGAGTALSSAYEQYYDAEDGVSLVTTIDVTIQQALEKYLKKAYEDNACAVGTLGIVMQVKTGEVLGMAQYPSYDLNDPRTISDAKTAEQVELIEDESARAEAKKQAQYTQWAIRPVNLTYEPGSVFKLVTAAIGLEEKSVSLTDTFYCPGYKMLGTQRVSCWKHGGHGSETFLEGLKNSCNPVFMETALRIGTDTYYQYLHTTGISERTGIDLQGEASGILHAESIFRETELAIASFGQRFKITPIRLLTTVCGLANGGKMMQPHLVRAFADQEGNILQTVEPEMISQIVSESTSDTICYMMEQVVATGTGKNAYVAGYRVGGKTATSEKLDAELKPGETEADKRIASFCAVAPMDDPELAVLLLIDEPRGELRQGGQVAGPVVGNLLGEILPYWGIEPVYSADEISVVPIEVPNLVRQDYTEAEKTLRAAGFTVRRIGSGSTVTSQVPAATALIPKGSTVVLYCGEEPEESTVRMPSLIGMTYDQARLRLENSGLYLHADGAIQTTENGSSKAISQSEAEGTEVRSGTVVTVRFADMVNTAND